MDYNLDRLLKIKDFLNAETSLLTNQLPPNRFLINGNYYPLSGWKNKSCM